MGNLRGIFRRSKESIKRWLRRKKCFIFPFRVPFDKEPLREDLNQILQKQEESYYESDSSQLEDSKELRDHASRKPWTVEVSWEICNLVGGIYTVIKTKAHKVVETVGDRYVAIGPYFSEKAIEELDAAELPPASPYYFAVKEIRKMGFRVVTGRWKISGKPLTILFDLDTARSRVLHRYRSELERDIGLRIPVDDNETNNAIIFGYLVAEFVAQFRRVIDEKFLLTGEKEPIVVHSHEWLGTIGLIFIWKWKIKVASVFTTHATLLGRYICAGGKDLYKTLWFINPDQEAKMRGILHRHMIEKTAARNAHVFTTVSEITGLEAEYLLGWKADIFTLNGLNLRSSPSVNQFEQLHQLNKCKIGDFVRKHFHDNICFERENVLYFFSAGRYEYRNKGIDILIESLTRLNHLLKISRTNIRVVVFFIYPAITNNLNEPTMKRHSETEQLPTSHPLLETETYQVFDAVTQFRSVPHIDEAVRRSIETISLDKASYFSQHHLLPPITTHNFVNDENDPILCELRRCQLFNYRYDNVKVVFYPQFLDKKNSILPLDYQEFIQGCDLGVFPSYYEPWGYTPAECIVNGTPSVTTNLSGYGQYMLGKNISDLKKHGVYVVDRRHASTKEAVQELTDFLLEFSMMTPSQRKTQRQLATTLGPFLDWDQMYENYRSAHCMAILRSL